MVISFFLGEVGDILYGHSPSKSSIVASWWPITFLPLVGPGRTATIQGFSKPSPNWCSHCVSKDNSGGFQIQLPYQSSHHQYVPFSPSAWSDGARGLASWTTNPVVGTTWVSISIGLVAQLVGKSFGISTMASFSSRVFTGPGGVCPASTSVGKAMGSTSGISSLGGCSNNDGVV